MRARAPNAADPQNIPPRAGSAPGAAQNVVTTPRGETAEVLSNAPVGRVDAEDVGQRDGLVRGSAVDPEAPPPVVDRYAVLRDCQFTHNGFRVKLTAGKTIDNLNYDVKHLARQGVKLRKLEDGEDAADAILAAGGSV